MCKYWYIHRYCCYQMHEVNEHYCNVFIFLYCYFFGTQSENVMTGLECRVDVQCKSWLCCIADRIPEPQWPPLMHFAIKTYFLNCVSAWIQLNLINSYRNDQIVVEWSKKMGGIFLLIMIWFHGKCNPQILTLTVKPTLFLWIFPKDQLLSCLLLF